MRCGTWWISCALRRDGSGRFISARRSRREGLLFVGGGWEGHLDLGGGAGGDEEAAAGGAGQGSVTGEAEAEQVAVLGGVDGQQDTGAGAAGVGEEAPVAAAKIAGGAADDDGVLAVAGGA